MPKVTSFKINLNPNSIPAVNDKLASDYPHCTEEEQVQLRSFIQTLDLFAQAKTLNDMNYAEHTLNRAKEVGIFAQDETLKVGSIYGKIGFIQSDREEDQEAVGKEITSQSNKDAKRLRTLKVELHDKIIVLENASGTAQKFFREANNHFLDLDLIMLYLEKEHGVAFTQEQKDYLNTQCAQDNLSGAISPMITNVGRDDAVAIVKDHYPIWKFDKNNTLYEISNKYDITLKNLETMAELASGEAMVTANVSSLTSVEGASRQSTIPYNMPKDITFSYQSNNNLALDISQSILDTNDRSLARRLQDLFWPSNKEPTNSSKREIHINYKDPLEGLPPEEQEKVQNILEEVALQNAQGSFKRRSPGTRNLGLKPPPEGKPPHQR